MSVKENAWAGQAIARLQCVLDRAGHRADKMPDSGKRFVELDQNPVLILKNDTVLKIDSVLKIDAVLKIDSVLEI